MDSTLARLPTETPGRGVAALPAARFASLVPAGVPTGSAGAGPTARDPDRNIGPDRGRLQSGGRSGTPTVGIPLDAGVPAAVRTQCSVSPPGSRS
jgi:hypothetical protein